MTHKPSSALAFLSTHADAILVSIEEAKGSTPREAGATMIVAAHDTMGTIGGGQLEYMAIAQARAMLETLEDHSTMQVPLGPDIGQCCGGRVALQLVRLTPERREALLEQDALAHQRLAPVFIFGAGHVGLALALALAPLPFRVTLIDTRAIIDGEIPDGVDFHRVAMPETQVAHIAPGGAAVIVTHDHALDFLIAREALSRDDLSYVGMIGSTSKRATFGHWLAREGGNATLLSRLTMPIGASALRDKRPAVIAALVAVELLHKIPV